MLPQSAAERFTKLRRGEWQITLIRAGRAKSTELTGDGKKQSTVVAQLLDRGVHESIARQIVRDIPDEKIQQKIRVHDWLLEKKGARRPSNPAGYLAASIRNDYATPKDYVDTKNSAKVRKKKRAKQKKVPEAKDQTVVQDTQERTAFDKFWHDLSASDQHKLEAQAMQEVDVLTLSVCERLQAKGGKMWDEMRLSIICRYAEAQGLIGA